MEFTLYYSTNVISWVANALAVGNYCQANQAKQICDGQGEGGARMWVFKFGDCC
jgi:hypothetical protein